MITVESRPDAPGVRLLIFDRPEARNAFNSRMYAALTAAFEAAAADDEVKVIVVTGAGTAFTAGQDLGELAALATGRAAGATEGDGHAFPAMIDALIALDKPVIGAVNGSAVGFGFTLLAHLDLVYVGESARMKVPFAEYGVPPEAASSYLFPQRLGWQRAASVLLTGDWVTAQQAVAWGLALEVVPDDELLDTVLASAARIASASLPALRSIKSLMQTWQRPAIQAALLAESAAYASDLGVTSTIPGQ
jgi:enoyl-CoA hydratase/carnithine racemase